MKAALTRSVQYLPEAGQPSWMQRSLKVCAVWYCKAPPSMVSAPNSGQSIGWGLLSNVCMASNLAQHSFGEFSGLWASAYKSPSSARLSAMKIHCASGSGALGLRSKKSPAGRQSDRLCRRVRYQRAADARAHLGTQGMHADHSVPLQLDACFGHRRADAYQLSVPLAGREYQERTGRRISEGAQIPSQTTIAGYHGRTESASQQIGARVSGRVGQSHPVGIPATLRARHESGRVFVGMAQAARVGQLLSGESGRIACQRTQQAQERTKTTFDHRRLLDAGCALVVS